MIKIKTDIKILYYSDDKLHRKFIDRCLSLDDFFGELFYMSAYNDVVLK